MSVGVHSRTGTVRSRAHILVDAARSWLKALWNNLIPHLYGEPDETRTERILRRIRIGVVIAACMVTLQSVLLVVGAWRDDRQIERNMGVAAAEVLSAGPRRSTIEFVTPDRVTYRPELGVLYPSELDTGMRIYVEYDKNDPDLVRVQDRNAALAIIPAGSIAVVGWLIAGGALILLGTVQKRLASRQIETAARQIETAARQIETASRQIETAARPIETTSRPVEE